jgi:ferrous iron transport protein A
MMDFTRHRLHHTHHQTAIALQAGATMPLSSVRPGQTVELVGIEECRRLRKRLADLGLNTGVCVRVVQNSFAGPLILAVREDARLAIGRGMARKITVAVPDDLSTPDRER